MIRRNIVSPISAFSQEGHWIKGKHEFFIYQDRAKRTIRNCTVDNPDPFLFGVFVAKDQRNHETQNAHRCYHSEDRWNAEFTL
jgi:hypothetical protein